MRLLLISNSTLYGSGYLDHAATEVADFLGLGVQRVLFVPFALYDCEAYAGRARKRFARLGIGLDSVQEARDPRAAVESAEALFVGGGKAFAAGVRCANGGRESSTRKLRLRGRWERVASGAPDLGQARARSWRVRP